MPERLPVSRPQANPEVLCPDALLESLGCGVVIVAADDRICLANGQAAGWIGESPESLRGQSHGEWLEQLQQGFLTLAVLTPPPGVTHSEKLETRGAPKRRLLREVRPLAGGGEVETLVDLSGEVAIDRDLHQLRERHAREVTALHTRLDQVEAFKFELTANVTHDLRTPLASIKASVSGLLAGDVIYDPQQLRETLSVIEEETDRLQRRVSNLLSMARMESGAADLSEDWVDLGDVAASALELLKGLRGEREIRFGFDEDLPLVQGDYIQLQIAVRNLIENALLYAPTDKPLEINVSANLGQVRVRVRDYGQGLMPDEFERIFDKFYRGRSARRIPGTGLGLPICRGIAEAHGGRLWAEHAPGGGVAFVLSLPASETEAEVEPPAS
jgi:signal transduction histidine kinase